MVFTKKRRRKDDNFASKKKNCKFCMEKAEDVDVYNMKLLKSFITERGKIIPGRISGACAKHQRKLSKVIFQECRQAKLLY